MMLLRRGRIGLLASALFSAPLVVGTDDAVSGLCDNVRKAESDEVSAMTHWLPRAQGQQLGIYAGAGICDKINRADKKNENYSVFDITLMYESTTQSNDNASYFGSSSGHITLGSGTGTTQMVANVGLPNEDELDPVNTYAYNPTNQDADIRAADLGLPNSYTASYCIRPQIRNFVMQIDWWCGWDDIAQGLFSRVRLPLTWSKWNLDLIKAEESGPIDVTSGLRWNDGDLPTFENFFTPGTLDRVADHAAPITVDGFGDTYSAFYTQPIIDGNLAFEGQTIPTSYAAVPPSSLDEKPSRLTKLRYAKACIAGRDLKLADVPVDLGYNFYLEDQSVVGIGLHTVFPAGTHEDGACLFSPRIGLGRWQVGGIANAQYNFWNKDTRKLTVYFNGFVTYACGTSETRLLGLKADSKYDFNHYLLLKKVTVDNTDLNDSIIGTERAANILYQPLKLSGFVNSDLALWLQYKDNGFDFTIGYNFTGRQAEGVKVNNEVKRVSSTSGLIRVENGDWPASPYYYVVKGNAPLYLANAAGTDDQPSPHCFDKVDSSVNTLGTLVPAGSAFPAYDQPLNTANLNELKAVAFTADDLVANPALHPTMITNTIFAYMGYTWPDRETATPFIGLGAMYEFGHGNAAMDMWGTFLKGGIEF